MIDKESWINGPALPKQIIADHFWAFCATALNSTTVLFFSFKSSGIKTILGYDMLKNTWFPMYDKLDFMYGNEDHDLISCTCTSTQEKTYQRYFVFLSLLIFVQKFYLNVWSFFNLG